VKFERISEWAEVSDCGCYSVSASVHGDSLNSKVKRYLFTAWRRSSDPKIPPTILKVDSSAEMCREACREDAKRQAA
jgi:hypothetical protein